MHRFIGCLLIILSPFSFQVSAEELPVVGGYKSPPKYWVDTNQQPRGVQVEILKEVGNRTGIEFSFHLSAWKRAIVESESGRGAILGFSKSVEREKIWLYSEPIYFDEVIFVARKNEEFTFTGLENLNGRKVAIKRGASYGDDFENAQAAGHFEAVYATDRVGQFRHLLSGQADLVLISPGIVSVEAAIAELPWLQENRDKLVVISPPYKLDPNYLGIPKEMRKEHLLPVINKALADMKQDGTFEAITDRVNAEALAEIRAKQPY